MPATWNTRPAYISSHSQSTHETRRRGPGRPSRAASVVVPWVTAWRPSSICTKTFSMQPSTMNHSIANPTLAPSLGVTISSPEPTMTAVMIRPGPSWRAMPSAPAGADTGEEDRLTVAELRTKTAGRHTRDGRPDAVLRGRPRRSPARRSGRAAGCRRLPSRSPGRTSHCRTRRSGCRRPGVLVALNASARSSAETRLPKRNRFIERQVELSRTRGRRSSRSASCCPRCSARARRRPTCRSRAGPGRCRRRPPGRRR